MYEKLVNYAAKQLELDPAEIPRMLPLRAWASILWISLK